jgi:magnesium transporter
MMNKLFGKRTRKIAQTPGTVEYLGQKKVEKMTISILHYDESQILEKEDTDLGEALAQRDKPGVSWINVNGLHDTEQLKQLGDHFGLHPLVQEDIVHTHQRPKIEDYGDYLFVVCRMIYYDAEVTEIETEQIALILGPRCVLSFQERPGDVFGPVRERLRTGKGRIRKLGADYLAYALLDAVVDNYFGVLEVLGDQIENLEDALLEHPTAEQLQTIHELKREMITLRRSVWPLREVINGLERSESDMIHSSTHVFLRDVYDHTIQVIDAVESFRDMLSGMQDLYLSSISNKMNEIMKVLTIIATIFVPLTFVAGIYGMNFELIPELKWKWGYLFFWVVCLIIGGWMVRYFRKKRWL